MVVIECTAAGCGWKSADRPEPFAAVLAAELANHTAVAHTAADIDKTLQLKTLELMNQVIKFKTFTFTLTCTFTFTCFFFTFFSLLLTYNTHSISHPIPT